MKNFAGWMDVSAAYFEITFVDLVDMGRDAGKHLRSYGLRYWKYRSHRHFHLEKIPRIRKLQRRIQVS